MPAVSHSALWPLVAFTTAAFVITGSIIGLTAVLGQRHRDRATDELYESGIPAAGPLPQRLSLEFYLVAMFFVVFDIETVFILAWAVAVRRLGWSGYLEVLLFVVLLLAALLYLWRLGSLDWGTSGRMSGREARLAQGDAAAGALVEPSAVEDDGSAADGEDTGATQGEAPDGASESGAAPASGGPPAASGAPPAAPPEPGP